MIPLDAVLQPCYFHFHAKTAPMPTTFVRREAVYLGIHIVPHQDDSTPCMHWRAETADPSSPAGCAVLRIVGLWDDTVLILTRNHLPIGCDSYPTVDDAIRHAEAEWGPILVANRYERPRVYIPPDEMASP